MFTPHSNHWFKKQVAIGVNVRGNLIIKMTLIHFAAFISEINLAFWIALRDEMKVCVSLSALQSISFWFLKVLHTEHSDGVNVIQMKFWNENRSAKSAVNAFNAVVIDRHSCNSMKCTLIYFMCFSVLPSFSFRPAANILYLQTAIPNWIAVSVRSREKETKTVGGFVFDFD